MNVSCRVSLHKHSIHANYNHPRKFLNCSNHRYYSNQSLMEEEHDTESIEDISNENSNNNNSISFDDRRDYVFIENAIFHLLHIFNRSWQISQFDSRKSQQRIQAGSLPCGVSWVKAPIEFAPCLEAVVLASILNYVASLTFRDRH